MFDRKSTKYILFILMLVMALGFRLPQLSIRPMHGDEAVNALKFSELLETGKYVYDPVEFHGPALPYFSVPLAWIKGQSTLKELNETTLRLLPVIFGFALLLNLLMIRSALGWRVILLTTFLMAISPLFVFYSRYYIHEMLIVYFAYTFIFILYRYSLKPVPFFACVGGLTFGFMVTTKETWIIFLVTMLFSVLFIYVLNRQNRTALIKFFQNLPVIHYSIFILSFAVVFFLLYSSFFQHLAGLRDAFTAYTHYFKRGSANEIHLYPWYMYFKWLLFFKGKGGSLFSEGFIVLLALFGILSVFRKNPSKNSDQNLSRFLALLTITTTIVFSAIPYKTPWNAMTFWFGFILLAALGMDYIFTRVRSRLAHMVISSLICFSILHLAWQSYRLNFDKYCRVDNPYVYAHPVEDVFSIAEKLEQIARIHPDGYQVHVEVIASDNDYWPLPWYLRHFTRIGWWNHIDHESPAAPIIISQAKFENELLFKLYELPKPGERNLYLPLFDQVIELRPGLEWRGYITLDIWNRLHDAAGMEMINREK